MPPGVRADPDGFTQARPEGPGHHLRGCRRWSGPDGSIREEVPSVSIHHIVEVGYVVIEPIHDPLEQPPWLPAASNDLLATGRVRVFDRCEFERGGRS